MHRCAIQLNILMLVIILGFLLLDATGRPLSSDAPPSLADEEIFLTPAQGE